MKKTIKQPKVCIVGAGPAGLSMARALKELDIPYIQFEKHSGLGGIWDIENEGSPMYSSAHFISSKKLSGFYNFPMPDHFAEYPTRQQVLRYTELFAEKFELIENIKFNTPVSHIEKRDSGWCVIAGSKEYFFSHLVCANGTTWDPKWPKYQGRFNGTQIHSVEYLNSDIFKDKRALIVGAGNSACDIACDAASVSKKAFISMRRGYHFVPKHIFGKPADEFGERSRRLPFALRQRLFSALLKLLNGDLGRYGLKKPDHKIFESHPIVNSQLIHYLSHGDIEARDDIERFDGNEVIFKDGKIETIDVIVYATGYKYSIPYLDKSHFDWAGDKPELARSVFNVKDDSLFAIGFTEMNSGGYYIFDEMSSLVAQAIKAQLSDILLWERIKPTLHHKVDFSGGINFVASSRHVNYLNIETFLKKTHDLVSKIDWIQAKELTA